MSEPTHMDARGTNPADRGDVEARVQQILNMIRPAVQSDGGDVELVAVTEEGEVQVRFHGACVGCPSSTMTLQSGIERQLKDRVPEVTSIRLVT